MKRSAPVVLLGLLFAQVAHAADGIVIWLEGTVPDVKLLKQTDKRTGPAQHMSHVDLAFPPMPATPEDAAKYEQLRAAVADGKARWDEFDVELGIAQNLEGILTTIDLIRDQRDLQDVVDARLFQGAAVQKAFDVEMFKTADEAKPFRISLPGIEGNNPWVQAMTLAPNREFTRADVADGSAFPDLQQLREPFSALAGSKMPLGDLPVGATLVLDGAEVAAGTADLSLRPGTHYFHVVRNSRVCGRQKLTVNTGEASQLPMLVDRTELEQAKAKVLEETTAALPEDVKASIELLSKAYEGPIFVAALDEKGRATVLPYARGAQLLRAMPVSILGVGEIGGAIGISRAFDDSNGANKTAPGIDGHLGVEIGVYNAAILGGMDLLITPGNSLTRANGAETKNVTSSVAWQPWGGLGVYALRPTGTTPTLLFAGTIGWDYPAWLAYGGRISLGILLDRGTWFRLTIGGNAATKSLWDEGSTKTPFYTMFLRFGLGTKFNN